LRHLPAAERAWLAGDITGAQVSLLTQARNERTAEAMEQSEKGLVDDATRLRFAAFQRLVAYRRQLADPDGDETRAARQVEDRRFDLSQTFQGAWVGDMVLDPIGGSIVATTLRRTDDELFRHDWAEAKERLGRDPLVTELRRTPKQRRADALVEMAIRARTAPKDGTRPAPLFTVLVGYETFAGRITAWFRRSRHADSCLSRVDVTRSGLGLGPAARNPSGTTPPPRRAVERRIDLHVDADGGADGVGDPGRDHRERHLPEDGAQP